MANTLFGLVDCAADPTLYPRVAASPGAACLYAGEIHPDLAAAAPYILTLVRDSPFLREWRANHWNANWGILCESDRPPDAVRFHFRHFMRAQLPDKSVVEFRFYDPRVFRAYLPTCDARELAEWFEGVARFIVPAEDGEGAIELKLNGSRLARRRLEIETFDAV